MAYLESDFSITCWDAQHMMWVIYAVVCALLVPIGWPAFVLGYTLWQGPHRLQAPENLNRFGIIYSHFKSNMLWFEAVNLVRKLFMTSLIVFFGKGSSFQIIVGIFVAVLAHILHAHMLPYEQLTNNMFQHACLGINWLTLVGGLTMKMVEAETQMGFRTDSLAVFLLVVNLCVPFAVLGAVVLGVLKMRAMLRSHIDQMKTQEASLDSAMQTPSSYGSTVFELHSRIEMEDIPSSRKETIHIT